MARELAMALLPVFVTLAVGYLAGRLRVVDNTNVDSLNRLVTTYTVPAALFASISATRADQIIAHLDYMAVFTLCMVVLYGATWWWERRIVGRGQDIAAVQALTVAFPNMAAVALPLAASVIGPQGAIAVAMGIAVGTLTITPFTLAVLEASNGDARLTPRTFGTALLTSMRKPILWSPVLAFALVLSGVRTPDLVEASLAPLSTAAIGASLFITGLIVSADRAYVDSEVALGVAAKNAVMPLLAWGLCVLLGLDLLSTVEAVLLSAVPSGFFGLVFAEGYGKRPPVSDSTVMVSTVLSIVTLALVIALLPSPF